MKRMLMMAMVLAAARLAAQSGPLTWEESRTAVSRLVRGRALVTETERYEPDARVIHGSRDALDFPVALPESVWRERLAPAQFHILRQAGTERPFSGALDSNKRRGVYYSAATGQPLFSSEDKYDSGTGWPSFTKPIRPDAVVYRWDTGLFTRRIEVADSLSGSHIGHVFNDGPEPTRQRYCMNSEAMIFVPEGEAPPPLLLP